MRKSLPHRPHAATQHSMRGRFTSLLVLIGLFFGVVAMPVIAHANEYAPAAEMLDVHNVDDAEHKHSQESGKDMPCHAISHHHCSLALHLDSPRINLGALTKGTLMRPAAVSPLASRSQAPPLEPPAA